VSAVSAANVPKSALLLRALRGGACQVDDVLLARQVLRTPRAQLSTQACASKMQNLHRLFWRSAAQRAPRLPHLQRPLKRAVRRIAAVQRHLRRACISSARIRSETPRKKPFARCRRSAAASRERAMMLRPVPGAPDASACTSSSSESYSGSRLATGDQVSSAPEPSGCALLLGPMPAARTRRSACTRREAPGARAARGARGAAAAARPGARASGGASAHRGAGARAQGARAPARQPASGATAVAMLQRARASVTQRARERRLSFVQGDDSAAHENARGRSVNPWSS
jgi:hypothetical protein